MISELKMECIKTIECYQKYLMIALEMGDKVGEGNAYDNIGNTYDTFKQEKKQLIFT